MDQKPGRGRGRGRGRPEAGVGPPPDNSLLQSSVGPEMGRAHGLGRPGRGRARGKTHPARLATSPVRLGLLPREQGVGLGDIPPPRVFGTGNQAGSKVETPTKTGTKQGEEKDTAPVQGQDSGGGDAPSARVPVASGGGVVPPRLGAIPKLKIPPGAGATAIAAITGKPHRTPDFYPRPTHAKDKPQSWQTAQEEKRGIRFRCKRCFAEFPTFKEYDLHQNKNKYNECAKYKEDCADLKDGFLHRPADIEDLNYDIYDDDIEVHDPDSADAQLQRLIDTLPSFSELGRPLFNDLDNYLRRHDEFMLLANVDARKERDDALKRDPKAKVGKVRYTWSKVKKGEESKEKEEYKDKDNREKEKKK